MQRLSTEVEWLTLLPCIHKVMSLIVGLEASCHY